MTITIKTGAEGPHWDPYGYDEISVEQNGQLIVGHFGLAEWVKVGPSRKQLDCVASGEGAEARFEELVGRTIEQLKEEYYEDRHTCKKCGCKETHDVPGYPGEDLNICDNCNQIVSTDFHESEII